MALDYFYLPKFVCYTKEPAFDFVPVLALSKYQLYGWFLISTEHTQVQKKKKKILGKNDPVMAYPNFFHDMSISLNE